MTEIHFQVTGLKVFESLLDAVNAVTTKWTDMSRCYSSTEEAVELAELLDVLAERVREVGR